MRALAPFVLPLLLIVGFGFGAAALLFGIRRGLEGWRLGRYLIVPGAIGALLIAGLIVRFPDDSLGLVPRVLRGGLVAGAWWGIDARWSTPIGIGALLIGILTADMVLATLPRYAGTAWGWLRQRFGRSDERSAGAVEVTRIVLGLAAAVAVVGSASMTSGLLAAEATGSLRVVATYELRGTPTSVVSADASSGYVAYAEGSIDMYRLPAGDGASMDLTEVASGLTYPRGLALADGRLFVIDLGPLPCDPPYPQCWTAIPDEELAVIAQSSASVLSYAVSDDGRLGDPQTILSDLPVVNTEHAPGSIDVGPDGLLYMTVGNIDRLAPTPDRLAEIDHPNLDLLGTLIRFGQDGSDVATIATGIRNVYQLARDPEGHLYGVDNGGMAVRGYHAEEVLALREGLHYGFPRTGTFDADRDPASLPLTVMTTGGSAGLAWAPDAGLEPGLLVGNIGQVVFVPLVLDQDGPYVAAEHPLKTELSGLNGFVSALEALPDRRLLVAIFGGYAGFRNQLLVVAPS